MSDLLRSAVDDEDLLHVRHVYIDVRPHFLELKRLRLPAQFVLVREALVGARIDHRDRSGLFVVTTAHIDTFCSSVIAQVIGSSLEIDSGDLIVGLAIVDVDLAASTGHKQLVRLRRESNPLGIGYAGDRMIENSASDINHFDGIAAESSHEQPASSHSEMVKTPFSVLKRNGFCQDQWPIRICHLAFGRAGILRACGRPWLTQCGRRRCQTQRQKKTTIVSLHRVLRLSAQFTTVCQLVPYLKSSNSVSLSAFVQT